MELGTNTVVGVDPAELARACRARLDEEPPPPAEISLWDGEAGVRAAEHVAALARRRAQAHA